MSLPPISTSLSFMESLHAECSEPEGLRDFKTLTVLCLGPWQRWGMSGSQFSELPTACSNPEEHGETGNKGFSIMDPVYLLVVTNLTWLLIRSRLADELRMHHYRQTAVMFLVLRMIFLHAYLFIYSLCFWSWCEPPVIIFSVIYGRLVGPSSCSGDMCPYTHISIYTRCFQ